MTDLEQHAGPASHTEKIMDEEEVFYDSSEYQPEELERLAQEAKQEKERGNESFAHGDYTLALEAYEKALSSCPPSDKELHSIVLANMGACYFRMNDFKTARDKCSQALNVNPSYANARFRRAQANEKIGSSSALSDALKDYEELLKGTLSPPKEKECLRAKQQLPSAIQVQMEKEKEEMMGKLKDLGNSILGKFGLSTDNFKFDKDPNTGSYNMNFVNQSAGGSSSRGS